MQDIDSADKVLMQLEGVAELIGSSFVNASRNTTYHFASNNTGRSEIEKKSVPEIVLINVFLSDLFFAVMVIEQPVSDSTNRSYYVFPNEREYSYKSI